VPHSQLPVALAVIFYGGAAERLADAAENLVRIWSNMVRRWSNMMQTERAAADSRTSAVAHHLAHKQLTVTIEVLRRLQDWPCSIS
jgi:hypothetical protein